MTGRGGEGMVVKPVGALVRDGEGRLVQPGVKCRGREYLRIVYGPEYTRPENLARLRKRFLNHKRSLALREYALGLEAPTGCGRRAAVAGARGGLRRAGAGVGAGRPPAVSRSTPGREPVDPRL
ncbi:hypothetical protein SFUMM280S_02800 [Streptomyces fumanus]